MGLASQHCHTPWAILGKARPLSGLSDFNYTVGEQVEWHGRCGAP